MIQIANAKPLYSGDIVGRDLAYPGMGWIGHVGIATGDNAGRESNLVIETLNESPVIQFNSIDNFKSRSPYWGSRYGIGDYRYRTLAVLAEANRQRWWCPKYTTSTAFVVGMGDINNGQPTICGVWRCDTFVAWSFFSAGYYELMENKIMLPRNVFNTFPYSNTELMPNLNAAKQINIGKAFAALSADELNRMPYEEFVMVADIPLNQETPTHIASEWKYAADHHVNEIKRGIFIDRLSMSNEKNAIPRFIEMYKKEQNAEIKSKLIQAVMIYYQSHREEIKASADYAQLKAFYDDLIVKNSSDKDADNIIRGYIDFHSPQEILENRKQIDKQFTYVEPHLALGLKQQLIFTSKELEAIYMPSMIEMLKKNNRSDLDDMFFGITKMGYKRLSNKSREQVKGYMDSVESKYISPGISGNTDPYLRVAKQSFSDLRNETNNT